MNIGIIDVSNSDWASPIVLVKKKDGSLCLCVDYRRLNIVIRADAYPMPRVDDLIDQLGKARFISTLGLTKGYWQVPILKNLGPRQHSPHHLGSSNSLSCPLDYQLLRGTEEYAMAYLDDLVIYSCSWENHLQHLRSILDKLQEAGLTAKPMECQFGMSQSVYLGHVVGSGVVQPEESKVKSVKSFPTPKAKKDIRTFLGLTGYYRKLIPDYASI